MISPELITEDLEILSDNAINTLARIKENIAANFFHQSFMHELAREGDVLSAEVLADEGHEIDLADDEGRRPLHEAVICGHLEMVKFLLNNGAYIDAAIQPFNHTALYLAVQKGNRDIAKHLIKRRANLHVQDKITGLGLLHLCAKRGDVLMAGLLISGGIDVFSISREGLTAREIAFRHGNVEIAKVLEKVMAHRKILVEA